MLESIILNFYRNISPSRFYFYFFIFFQQYCKLIISQCIISLKKYFSFFLLPTDEFQLIAEIPGFCLQVHAVAICIIKFHHSSLSSLFKLIQFFL